MNIKSSFGLAGSLIFLATLSSASLAAPGECQGPNKNDPGCNDPPPPPPPAVVVNSATVDWLNERITIRGESLDAVTSFSLGGSPAITPQDVSPTIVNLPFDDDVAGTVTEKGNYQLNIDGTDVLSLFVKSQIIDSAAGGCPCQGAWEDLLLNDPTLQPAPVCYEDGSSQFAGTVSADPSDPTSAPKYVLGATFLVNDPVKSVCELVQVNSDTSYDYLVSLRINQTQQSACAEFLANDPDYCTSTEPFPTLP